MLQTRVTIPQGAQELIERIEADSDKLRFLYGPDNRTREEHEALKLLETSIYTAYSVLGLVRG